MSEQPRDTAGDEIHSFITELFPLCRSISGDGLRETLDALASVIPIEVHEAPSGAPALDWVVPDEWNVREAWLKAPDGSTVVDFADSNLHLMSYSEPVHTRIPLADLRPHLHSIPDHPDWIPYRTSYYRRDWGFCLPHRLLESLPDGEYEVCIDASLEPGALTYGELVLRGISDEEVLISAHVCHPSLANDNLSGVAVAAFLARELAAREARRYSYRFLFAPGTIGALVWLSRNRDGLDRVRHGLTLAGIGDASPLTYKRSFAGDATIDRVVAHVLRASGRSHEIVDFSPYGHDERQYNAPGFRLPVGALQRGVHDRYPEYHSSADNLDFVLPGQLADSLSMLREVVEVLEGDRTYVSLAPFGEPQLGKRGLYRTIGGSGDPEQAQLAMFWILSCADGRHSLLDIAERSGLPFTALRDAARALERHELLRPQPDRDAVPGPDAAAPREMTKR